MTKVLNFIMISPGRTRFNEAYFKCNTDTLEFIILVLNILYWQQNLVSLILFSRLIIIDGWNNVA